MTTRVALDLLGGDFSPAVLLDGATLAMAKYDALHLTLVGPIDVAQALVRTRDLDPARLDLVAASQVVGMTEDPARAVRAKRDATVRVAARLVRDGLVDATVSVGSTGAAMAAGVFTIGRIPGVTRPALAITIPALRGPLVLLDAGANVSADPDLLAQFALTGSAYASVRLGLPRPRVALLSIGEEAGKGDEVRQGAHALLAGLPTDCIDYIGNVEGHDVAIGGVADVIVTDGFTGNVLLKGLEGAVIAMRERLLARLGDDADDRRVAEVLTEASAIMGADGQGGALLLGVNGVSVVGHGSSSPRAVAACIGTAVHAHVEGLLPKVTDALAVLVTRRCAESGFGNVGTG